MTSSTNGNDVPAEATAYRQKYGIGPMGRPYLFIDPDGMCVCGYRGRDHGAKGDSLMAGSHCRRFTLKPEEPTE